MKMHGRVMFAQSHQGNYLKDPDSVRAFQKILSTVLDFVQVIRRLPTDSSVIISITSVLYPARSSQVSERAAETRLFSLSETQILFLRVTSFFLP
jgi:hypothetical protein